MQQLARIFLGIPIDPQQSSALVQLVRQLYPELEAQVRWLSPNCVHITVRFIGAMQRDSIPLLIQAIKNQLQAHPISNIVLQTSEIDHFPAKSSGILAALIKPHPMLTELFNTLEKVVTQLGFKPELRTYKPHITLCRPVRKHHYAIQPIMFDQQDISVKELILYESLPEKNQSVYHALHRFTF